jgi:hypothetical protein
MSTEKLEIWDKLGLKGFWLLTKDEIESQGQSYKEIVRLIATKVGAQDDKLLGSFISVKDSGRLDGHKVVLKCGFTSVFHKFKVNGEECLYLCLIQLSKENEQLLMDSGIQL